MHLLCRIEIWSQVRSEGSGCAAACANDALRTYWSLHRVFWVPTAMSQLSRRLMEWRYWRSWAAKLPTKLVSHVSHACWPGPELSRTTACTFGFTRVAGAIGEGWLGIRSFFFHLFFIFMRVWGRFHLINAFDWIVKLVHCAISSCNQNQNL